VQLVVIDTTGEIKKISRFLHNEGLPIESNGLTGHPYASFVSDHLPWKSQAYVVDLSKAAARRVFDLVRLSSKDLPLILVGSSIQNLYTGKPPALFYSSVVADDAMELLGPALDREYEFSRQQTLIREHDRYIQQFLQCCYGAFDVSPNPIAIINDNGHLYANAAYLQLFNYSAFDQIRDCQFKHLIQEEKQSEFSQALADLDNPCAACTVDLELQCGSSGTVHITCLPGSPAKYQVVFKSLHSAVTSSATNASDTATNQVASEDPSAVTQQPANQHTEDLAVWTERIVSALSKNRLFSVVYQPIVGLCGVAQNSYEALLRMHDNAGYEHMPASFIPAAEKSGLMGRVDQWVISHVTRVIKESQARDEPLSLFVNLSRDSLFNESFPDWLRETVSDTGIEGTYLTLEVSLDVVLDDLKAARQAMRAIRAVGCRVVLDDYGIESVNAGILRQVSVDFVKVDRKLMRDQAFRRAPENYKRNRDGGE
jgi:EAL domain-containing protein (putative c-di-GMP-specific phosphodiesterase class I)/PAS domain-containing protein